MRSTFWVKADQPGQAHLGEMLRMVSESVALKRGQESWIENR